MKSTLEFDLSDPFEMDEYIAAVKATDIALAIREILCYLIQTRNQQVKLTSKDTAMLLNCILETITIIINERGIRDVVEFYNENTEL